MSRAGFPEDRAEDVVLAVHELTANAVRHGGGAGRLRVWILAGALHCQVDDGDLLASPRQEDSRGRAAARSLHGEQGHGLWVAQQVADQLLSFSGPAGTSVLVRFDQGT